MNSTAALPFELPSLPVSGRNIDAASAISRDSRRPGPSDAGSFDEALSARSQVTRPVSEKPDSRRDFPSRSTDGGRKSALINPADYRNPRPMPSSLVPQTPDEPVASGDVEAEVDKPEHAPVGTAYEWVCALNGVQPAPQQASSPDVSAARGEALSIGDSATSTTPSAEGDPAGQPVVVSRELFVSGHRVEASALGEYPAVTPDRSGRPANAKLDAAVRSRETESSGLELLPEPESPETPPVAVHRAMPAGRVESHQPLTAEELAQAVAKRLQEGGNHPLAAAKVEAAEVAAQAQQPGKNLPDWIKPSSEQPKTIEIPVRRASLAEMQADPTPTQANRPELSLNAQAVVEALENRLKAAGIQVSGTLQVEVSNGVTSPESGRNQVGVENRLSEMLGQSDKSGRIGSGEGGLGEFRSGADSDGKNQPGSAAAGSNLPPESGRTIAADPSSEAPESAVNPMVSRQIGTPKSARSTTGSVGGISTARQAIAMRSTNDQEEFAGNATSRSSAGLGRTGEAASKSRPQDLLTELAAMPFADRVSRAQTAGIDSTAPLDRIVQSDRIDKLDAVEKMRSVINHELAVLKASGADALAVVIRPTTDTEVFVQLTREKGGVEAFIRVEKGDLAELRRHWGQLEGALAEQQVRLQPMQSSSPMNQESESQSRQNRFTQQGQDNAAFGNRFSFDGQSRGGFRQDDPRRPQSPFETESFSPRTPNPSTPRSAPRRGTSTDRNFDNWA